MSNTLVEGLFLLAFWLPPLTVFACAALLLVKVPSSRQSSAPSHSALATR